MALHLHPLEWGLVQEAKSKVVQANKTKKTQNFWKKQQNAVAKAKVSPSSFNFNQTLEKDLGIRIDSTNPQDIQRLTQLLNSNPEAMRRLREQVQADAPATSLPPSAVQPSTSAVALLSSPPTASSTLPSSTQPSPVSSPQAPQLHYTRFDEN